MKISRIWICRKNWCWVRKTCICEKVREV